MYYPSHWLDGEIYLTIEMRTNQIIFTCVCYVRSNVAQLMSITQRAIATVTSSVQCSIILPTEFLLDCLGEDIEGERAKPFCTYSAETGDIMPVLLDDGDIELVALERAPSSNQEVLLSSDGNTATWQSWSLRRVEYKLGVDALEERLSDERGAAANIVVNAFPLTILYPRKGIAHGVVAVIRPAVPFTGTDKKCVSWLVRLFSTCLEQMVERAREEKSLAFASEERASKQDYQLQSAHEDRVRLLETEIESLRKTRTALLREEEDFDVLLASFTSIAASYVPKFGGALSVDDASEDVETRLEELMLADAISCSFGCEEAVEIWSFRDPIDALQLVLQLDAILLQKESSADNSSSSSTSSLSPLRSIHLFKDSVSTDDFIGTYWVDSEGAYLSQLTTSALMHRHGGEGDADSNKERKLQVILNSIQAFISTQRHSNEVDRASRSTMYLSIHLKKSNTTKWAILSSPSRWNSKRLKMHMSVFLTSLRARAVWTQRCVSFMHQSQDMRRIVDQVERKCAEEVQSYEIEVSRQRESERRLKTDFKATLDGAKEKYKLLRDHSHVQRSMIEGVLVEAMAFESLFVSKVLGNLTLAYDEGFIKSSLLDISHTLSRLSKIDIALGFAESNGPSNGFQWLTTTHENMRWSGVFKSGGSHASSHRPHTLYDGTKEDPLQLCLATRKVVVVLDGDGRKGNRVNAINSLFSHSSSDNAESHLIPVPAQPGFPSDMFIVPISVPQVDLTFIVVVSSSDGENKERSGHAVDTLFPLLVAWISIRECVKHAYSSLQRYDISLAKAREASLRTILRVKTRNISVEYLTLYAFEKWKTLRMAAQLRSAANQEPELLNKLSAAKFKIRNLERASADWKELLTGLCSSAAAISLGIADAMRV